MKLFTADITFNKCYLTIYSKICTDTEVSLKAIKLGYGKGT